MESLEVETRDGLQRIALDKPHLTIGRLPGNDIVLPYAQISRHHAEVRQRNQGWWIIDLGSTNGLHVNGRVIKEHLLHGGDSVVLAPAIILHFLGQRPRADRMVEGTLELPSVAKPPPALPLPDEPPPERPLSALASASAVPLPRRRLGMTPPPVSQGARPATPLPPHSTDPPPLSDNALDAWLREEQIDAPLFVEVEKTPGKPPAVPAKPKDGDLPLSSPFALMRRVATPTGATKKPILAICPTCGERTAPDSPYCWSCRQTIAQPCRICQLYLLPIQATCSRCGTPNAHAVKR